MNALVRRRDKTASQTETTHRKKVNIGKSKKTTRNGKENKSSVAKKKMHNFAARHWPEIAITASKRKQKNKKAVKQTSRRVTQTIRQLGVFKRAEPEPAAE